MVEPITLQTTISLLTLISLTIGVFYYVLTLRNQNRARARRLEEAIKQYQTREISDFLVNSTREAGAYAVS